MEGSWVGTQTCQASLNDECDASPELCVPTPLRLVHRSVLFALVNCTATWAVSPFMTASQDLLGSPSEQVSAVDAHAKR